MRGLPLRACAALLPLSACLLSADASAAARCTGDCDGDGSVTVSELVLGVNIALDRRPVEACRAFDRGGGAVEIGDLIAAVRIALSGCPTPTVTPDPPTVTQTTTPSLPPTPTASATASPTATRTPIPGCIEPTAPAPVAPSSTPCLASAGAYVDCFASSGLGVGRLDRGENGAAVADVDGDGFPDVFFWNNGGGARLFRNLGHDMQFEVVPASRLSWDGWTTVVAAAFGDLDNDGRPDLVVVLDRTLDAYLCGDAGREPLNTFRVYRNLGELAFADVTEEWGFEMVPLEPGDKPFGVGLALVDLNFDGRLDVVEYRRNLDLRPLAFISQPDQSWSEAGRDVFGDGRGLTWSLFFTDLDHDQLPDAFILNDFYEDASSKYYRRVGGAVAYAAAALPPVFGDVAFGSPMGAASGDLNGDGELDLIVTDSGDQHVFSLGLSVASAWGVSQNPSRFGLLQTCWSPAVIDVENDGIPDLFFGCGGFRIGNPDRAVSFILRNGGGGAFQLVEGLLPNEDVPTWEQGLATADFDQDGRLDLLTGGEEHAPRLLWNRVPGGHALAIRLKGATANAEGIGARVTVKADGLPVQVREMYPGGATWSYGDSQLLFGLGAATSARVTVDWRPAGGRTVQIVNLTPGRALIEESASLP